MFSSIDAKQCNRGEMQLAKLNSMYGITRTDLDKAIGQTCELIKAVQKGPEALFDAVHAICLRPAGQGGVALLLVLRSYVLGCDVDGVDSLDAVLHTLTSASHEGKSSQGVSRASDEQTLGVLVLVEHLCHSNAVGTKAVTAVWGQLLALLKEGGEVEAGDTAAVRGDTAAAVVDEAVCSGKLGSGRVAQRAERIALVLRHGFDVGQAAATV